MRTTFFTIFAFFLAPIAIADTEPANNDWNTAEPLAQDTSVTGTQSDDDWYVINAAGNDRILIDLTFTHADGDIDLALFNDGGVMGDPTVPGTLRANSAFNVSDHEFVDIAAKGVAATYYIRVNGGAGGDQGNSYTLTWTQLPGSDDGFEDNDSNVAAAAITESTVSFGSQSDADWYSIDAAADGTRLLVSLRFNAANDLDLVLHDVGGTPLASSETVGNGINEAIDYTAPTMGTYHLSVSGNDSGDGYAIDWEGITPTPNEVPVATANTVSTPENTAYNFAAGDFTFSDTEGDSLVSATITSLSLGGGALTYSGGTTLNAGDTLTAAQLGTLVYTPPADLTGSPLATFDFTVNDAGVGIVAAQMDIDVLAAPATPAPTGGSSGSISLLGLFALMLIGVVRRVHR